MTARHDWAPSSDLPTDQGRGLAWAGPALRETWESEGDDDAEWLAGTVPPSCCRAQDGARDRRAAGRAGRCLAARVHPERAGDRRHGRHGRRWHARPGAGRAGPGGGRHADRPEVVAVPLGRRRTRRARSNWITPAKVLEAAKLIKTGKIYELGRMYEVGHAALRLPGLRAPNPRHADRGPVRQEQARLPRRVRRHRDRPGRDPVRRARPHRLHRGQGRRHDRDALLQRLHRGRDGERLRPPEARASSTSSRSSRAGSSSTSRASRGAC